MSLVTHSVGVSGSSPLTRGKRGGDERVHCSVRLIPAHAGKTCWPGLGGWGGGAHPRSRGENLEHGDGSRVCPGSSPLTRGKPTGWGWGPCLFGLIPAHAGKTIGGVCAAPAAPAHPRSRGENSRPRGKASRPAGSSPLTRGKRVLNPVNDTGRRLIPAHAGKTFSRPVIALASAAHPRSRGENQSRTTAQRSITGSSPLTRGKPVPGADDVGDARLIPAHAGKTGDRDAHGRCAGAHPRSRGENTYRRTGSQLMPGSSPLTRGKRLFMTGGVPSGRLIPAHAGKTQAARAAA